MLYLNSIITACKYTIRRVIMEKIINKARVLVEALPYFKSFSGATFVIKYGGSAMTEAKFKDLFMQDLALLNYTGINLIIVHGGGENINSMIEKLGMKPKFIKGHRVTDKETLDVVEMVLAGSVNKEIVKNLNMHGIKAIGLNGKDANLLMAKKKKTDGIDLGFVGEVTKVNVKVLENLDMNGFTPVIAPIGVDEKGNGYNINADTAAGAVAEAVKCDKLIYVTDTDGVKIAGKYAQTIHVKDITKFIKRGDITGGMLPKINSAKKAVEAGVKKVHIINGTVEHSLLLEIFTNEGIGTEIVK
jgi:acetylglutamate kinase